MNAPIAVTGLTRRFDDLEAVRGLDFEVGEGEIYGLVGPDGAGKTTTIRAVAGLLEPTSGDVRVLGRDPLREGARVRELLGLMPQQYSLYADLSVAENLRFFARLFCLPRSTYASRVERLLAITRLAPFTERRAGALSGGMYKKLALACALLHQPRVLLLDEPTNGVDPVSRRELWDLLYEFTEEGMSVLLSTPTMDEAERCHRVGLVHHGALLAEGEPDALVEAFDHDTFEVRGGDTAAVHATVERLAAVRGATPAGSRVRIVVAPDGHGQVARALAATGAELVPVRADFEDVFLARVAAEEAA